jgi:hypothetical protein
MIRVDTEISDELTTAFPELIVRDPCVQTTLTGELPGQDELLVVLGLLRLLAIDVVRIVAIPD